MHENPDQGGGSAARLAGAYREGGYKLLLNELKKSPRLARQTIRWVVEIDDGVENHSLLACRLAECVDRGLQLPDDLVGLDQTYWESTRDLLRLGENEKRESGFKFLAEAAGLSAKDVLGAGLDGFSNEEQIAFRGKLAMLNLHAAYHTKMSGGENTV